MNQRGRMPGHLFMISSSRYPNDFTERKSQEALNGDKSIFVRDYAVWETKPAQTFMSGTFKVEVGDQSKRSRVLNGGEDNVNEDRIIDVPMDYKDEFELDTDAAVRDFAGIPVLAIRPFIVRREKIVDMFKRGAEVGAKHPFTRLDVTLGKHPSLRFNLNQQGFRNTLKKIPCRPRRIVHRASPASTGITIRAYIGGSLDILPSLALAAFFLDVSSRGGLAEFRSFSPPLQALAFLFCRRPRATSREIRDPRDNPPRDRVRCRGLVAGPGQSKSG